MIAARVERVIIEVERYGTRFSYGSPSLAIPVKNANRSTSRYFITALVREEGGRRVLHMYERWWQACTLSNRVISPQRCEMAMPSECRAFSRP